MLKNCYFIIFSIWMPFCLIFIPENLYGNKYLIKNFSPEDYRAGIQNIAFAQNRNKTIFVANNLGILSYNGIEWRTHDRNTGKKKRSLAFDIETNRLYVGSQQEFGYYDDAWNFISLTDLIPADGPDFDEVWDVYTMNSLVYFCTFSAIYVYDGSTIDVISIEGGFDRCFYSQGTLYAQNRNGEIFKLDQMEVIDLPLKRSNDFITVGLIPWKGYNIQFYNSGEVIYGQDDPFIAEVSRRLKGSYVNHVLEISGSRIVVATQKAGLFIINLQSRIIDQITKKDDLGSNTCLRTFQDYDGNLWIGLQNGIALIDINSPISFIKDDAYLDGSGYDLISTDYGTYYSTSSGVYFQEEYSSSAVFIRGTEGPAYDLTIIENKVYACHHTGLFLLNKTTARKVAAIDGLWKIQPLNGNPGIYVGGTYSGLHRFSLDANNQLKSQGKVFGFNESSRFLEEDNQGRIWVSQYYKGLYILSSDNGYESVEIEKVEQDGVPIYDQVIIEKIDNVIHVATKEGLYKIDEDNNQVRKAEIFHTSIGDDQVYHFTQDEKNNVHIITDKEIGYFKQISPTNYSFVSTSLHQQRFNLNNDLLNISDDTRWGVVYSANEGFIDYDLSKIERIDMHVPPVVSSIMDPEKDSLLYRLNPFSDADPISNLTVSNVSKTIHIDVESYQYNGINHQEFRYKLEGLEDNYGPWTYAHSKEYSNLKSGDYIFTSQTKNALGGISTSHPLQITVTPPFYKSVYAKGIYGLLSILLLLGAFRFQRNRYKRKESILNQEKNAKIEEEKRRRLEIEKTKETEMLKLKDEKLQSEITSMENLLASSTMNLVVKNEFIQMIKEQLQVLKKETNRQEINKSIDRINKEINTTLRLNEDWEQFEVHFDKVHGEFLSRIRKEYPDLSPNEQKLCAFLRLNLSSKEIANFMSISARGVEVARYRLRKKLSLEQGKNLSKFILQY